mmetsp:Transcript_800/g.2713  ORF Transcript_800/g.2713 Transcript_800/m.2713 type:complete len:87 (-) Transcript_800:313-573(-)
MVLLVLATVVLAPALRLMLNPFLILATVVLAPLLRRMLLRLMMDPFLDSMTMKPFLNSLAMKPFLKYMNDARSASPTLAPMMACPT